jgi:hypothetical protein
MADHTEQRASKSARFGNSGPRHSTREFEELDNVELRGSFIEKKFQTFGATGTEWYRGQLIHPIRGGNFWMVRSMYLNFFSTEYLKIFD